MTVMSHQPAAHARQLLERSMNGTQHRKAAQRRAKQRVGRPGACSLEFVNKVSLAEDGREMGMRETLPHEVDADRLAALMLAMASRRISGAARMYVAACIAGGQSHDAVDSEMTVRNVPGAIKSPLPSSLYQRPSWRAMLRKLSSDPEVITYFVWPPCVALNIVADDGFAVPRATYAPDLLIVRRDEIVVMEIREGQSFAAVLKERAANFCFTPTGVRGYPRPEALFKSMGICYVLRLVNPAGSAE